MRFLMVTVVILSAAKDLTERSDTDRVAGARSFAALRTTGKRDDLSGAKASLGRATLPSGSAPI
jgi:hypothetical protein